VYSFIGYLHVLLLSIFLTLGKVTFSSKVSIFFYLPSTDDLLHLICHLSLETTVLKFVVPRFQLFMDKGGRGKIHPENWWVMTSTWAVFKEINEKTEHLRLSPGLTRMAGRFNDIQILYVDLSSTQRWGLKWHM
jgi:hypothetical protein